MAFRLGQSAYGPGEGKAGNSSVKVEKDKAASRTVAVSQKARKPVIEKPKQNVAAVKETEVDLSSKTGSNRIVILTCENSRDIEPVKEFFESFGIGTETRNLTNGKYLLVSSKKYDSPGKILI